MPSSSRKLIIPFFVYLSLFLAAAEASNHIHRRDHANVNRIMKKRAPPASGGAVENLLGEPVINGAADIPVVSKAASSAAPTSASSTTSATSSATSAAASSVSYRCGSDSDVKTDNMILWLVCIILVERKQLQRIPVIQRIHLGIIHAC